MKSFSFSNQVKAQQFFFSKALFALGSESVRGILPST